MKKLVGLCLLLISTSTYADKSGTVLYLRGIVPVQYTIKVPIKKNIPTPEIHSNTTKYVSHPTFDVKKIEDRSYIVSVVHP